MKETFICWDCLAQPRYREFHGGFCEEAHLCVSCGGPARWLLLDSDAEPGVGRVQGSTVSQLKAIGGSPHRIPRCPCGSVTEAGDDLPDSAEGRPREERLCIDCERSFVVTYAGTLTLSYVA